MALSSQWGQGTAVTENNVMNLVTSNILMAMGMGAAIGIAIVASIALFQANQRVNSLTDAQDFVDAIVTVRIPFNQTTVGSIWIDRADQRVVMAAKTHESQEFLRGDRAVIVEIRDGKAWVSHADPSWLS
jgi:hypothetical protein